jgi:hypothetical protein
MSSTRQPGSSRRDGAEDVGTLWTMHRLEHRARCALIARRNGWEVRVLIGRDLLLEERCDRADQAFSLGERWRVRMLENGWQQVVPAPARDGPPAAAEPPITPRRL